MIEGELIRLRAWRDDDVAPITALRNDVALQSQLLARVRGSQQSQVRNWLEKRSTDPGSMLLVIADRNSDAALGYVQITDMDSIDRRGEFGICLGNSAQGRGFGSEAIKILLPYVRETWGIRKLNLRVRTDNVGAIRCYEKSGFIRCGLLREHTFFDGVWLDVALMEVFLSAGN